MELRGQKLVYAVTAVCALAFCLFGYDNGLMGEIVTEESFLDIVGHPNTSLLGFVVSSYDVGCMIGALGSMVFGDRFGRRYMIFIGCGIHILATIITTASFSLAQVLVSRIIIGVGMGIFTSTCPVWLAECADASSRELMVAIQLTHLIIGTNISFWLNYGMSFINSSVSWRLPFAVQMLFTSSAFILTIFLPESPRWLLAHGRQEEALKVLGDLRGDETESEIVQAEFQDISNALSFEENNSGSWSTIFKGNDESKALTRIIIASAAQALQSCTGICFLEYYFPYILENSVGLSSNISSLVSGCSQVWYLLSSFLTWILIRRLGRRRLFFLGSAGMGFTMMAITICLWYNSKPASEASVAFLFLYLSFFTWGWMSNMWTYPAEILPLQYRSKGLAISVFFQWAFQFWTVEIAPVSVGNIGWRTYIIWTVLNFATLAIVYFLFPETSGMTLEAVDFMFSGDSNIFRIVRKSDKMFRKNISWEVGMAQEVANFDFAPRDEKQVQLHVEEADHED